MRLSFRNRTGSGVFPIVWPYALDKVFHLHLPFPVGQESPLSPTGSPSDLPFRWGLWSFPIFFLPFRPFVRRRWANRFCWMDGWMDVMGIPFALGDEGMKAVPEGGAREMGGESKQGCTTIWSGRNGEGRKRNVKSVQHPLFPGGRPP